MTDEKRPYRKQRRAELEQATRRRITASAVELHGSLGPSRTSISAVAAHAGVRRSTLYRHFPDEAALFAACIAHWMASNPVPDLARWAAIGDPGARLRAALPELYAHYRRTERMMDNILRDEEIVPIVKQMFSGFRDYIDAAHATLMAGRRVRGRARERQHAAVGHALAFSTWRSLTREQHLDDAQAADLMQRLVETASARPAKRS
jgi:AcrR family transcriptional regulator